MRIFCCRERFYLWHMKNQSGSGNQTTAIILVVLLFLFGSCQTYKYGYLGKMPLSPELFHSNVDTARNQIAHLQQKKQLLIAESFSISETIKKNLLQSEPVPYHTLNLLFENLQKHYQIDTVYHYLMQHSPDETIQGQSKKALLETAVNYKKAFQGNKFIRRTINRGDLAFGVQNQTLSRTQHFLWSDKSNRNYLVQNEKDRNCTYTKAGHFLSRTNDNYHATIYKTAHILSGIFGNTAGAFHGHIDKEKNAKALKSNLKEFDIVLLKSITHLTEKFIPGYFGHVGVYLDNNLIIEAPRSGVRICDTEEFANGEIFLVIRPVNLSAAQAKKIKKLLYSQLGKKYDFNFDSQSPDKVICTELVSLAFDYVDWKTHKVAGRYTTSPDELVKSLMNRDDFEFETYISQGEFIAKPDTAFISALLKGE